MAAVAFNLLPTRDVIAISGPAFMSFGVLLFAGCLRLRHDADVTLWYERLASYAEHQDTRPLGKEV